MADSFRIKFKNAKKYKPTQNVKNEHEQVIIFQQKNKYYHFLPLIFNFYFSS